LKGGFSEDCGYFPVIKKTLRDGGAPYGRGMVWGETGVRRQETEGRWRVE